MSTTCPRSPGCCPAAPPNAAESCEDNWSSRLIVLLQSMPGARRRAASLGDVLQPLLHTSVVGASAPMVLRVGVRSVLAKGGGIGRRVARGRLCDRGRHLG